MCLAQTLCKFFQEKPHRGTPLYLCEYVVIQPHVSSIKGSGSGSGSGSDSGSGWLPTWLYVGSSWPQVGLMLPPKSFKNRPKCLPNRSILVSERALEVSWEASGGAWRPSRLQDGFKTPKVKVLTLSWRPCWTPKSIKNRI